MATVEATEATETTEAVQKTQKKNDSLGFYWDLASNDLAKRQKACLLLTKHLMKFKTELHVASKEDIELLPLDIQYALNRLLKGLSSSRDSARQGFSLALTELLTIQPIQTSVLLTLLHEISEKNGSSSGQEERELYFSRIFGYQAIALSGNLSNATSDDIKLMVATILKFNSKKSYLKSATTKVLLLILENVQTNSNNLELSKMICTMFFVDNNDSAEAVWFFIESQKYQLNLVAVLSEWKKGDMFYTKNKQKLFKILEQSTSSLIHPVFPSLIAKLSEKNKDISLLDFWTFCEENFFNSTHERKYVGFQIFQMVLNTLSANEIPQIFTPNFMRCLINSLSSKEAYLNKCARVSMIGVVEISKKDNNIALALVLELLGKNGHFKFDSLTKTKTIEGITSSLDVKGIEKYLQHLTQCYYDPSLIGKEDEVKKWSVEQMYLLLKQGRIEKTESWVLYILKFIAAHAFFKIQKTDKASGLFECELLPKDFRDYFKDKLMTAVGLLNNTVLKGYMKGKLRNGSSWAYEVFQILVEMENDSRFELVDKLSDAKREAVKVGWKKVSEVKAFIKTIPVENKKTVQELEAFESLFNNCCLLVYCDLEENGESVEELCSCYKLLFEETKGAKKRKAEELEPVEVLADLLISFLAKNSAMMRTLSSEVFKVFAPKFTPKVLEIIFEVLSAGTGVDGANELFEEEEAEDFEDSDEMDNESDSEEEEGGGGDVDEELRQSIEQAMEQSVEQDMDDLGDDDMEMFDSKLAEIFGQRKQIKKAKKETKENVLHFKLRVLDLFDIFLKSSMKTPIVMDAYIKNKNHPFHKYHHQPRQNL